MNARELLRQTWVSLKTHKLRSFLALFGIMWGALSVVILMALGNGFYNQSQHNMRKIANGQIFLRAGVTSKPYAGKPSGQILHLKAKDVLAMGAALPNIQRITPMLNYATIDMHFSYQGKHAGGMIDGVSSSYASIAEPDLGQPGHFFTELDQQHANKVIFLNDNTKQILFGNHNPVGKTVAVEGIPFTVVGFEAPQKQQGGMHWKGHLSYIPYTTYQQIWGDQDSAEVLALASSPEMVDAAKRDLQAYLANHFHFDPSDTQAVMMPDLTKVVHFFNWFFWGIKSFLLFCGALTLAVGGIGVANIMFLIVNERTPEIGLRLALGAPDNSILWQFLMESLLLVCIGGIAGLAMAVGIVTALQHMALPEWIGTPVVSPLAMLISFVTLVIVGLSAGFFPAKKASMLPPVVALAF